MPRMLRLAGTVILTLSVLAGCDQVAQTQLQPGVAGVEDVIKLMGKPSMVTDGENGEKIYHFPRQPEGYENFIVRIGPDNKLVEIKQLLTEANFAEIKPGMTRDEVRKRLGPEMKTQDYPLKNEKVMSWRFRVGSADPLLFDVIFGEDGLVKETGRSPDPKTQAG